MSIPRDDVLAAYDRRVRQIEQTHKIHVSLAKSEFDTSVMLNSLLWPADSKQLEAAARFAEKRLAIDIEEAWFKRNREMKATFEQWRNYLDARARLLTTTTALAPHH